MRENTKSSLQPHVLEEQREEFRLSELRWLGGELDLDTGGGVTAQVLETLRLVWKCGGKNSINYLEKELFSRDADRKRVHNSKLQFFPSASQSPSSAL